MPECPCVPYSEIVNGCFCVSYVFFHHEVPNRNTMTKYFYSELLIGFNKNAHERLADSQNKTGTIHKKTQLTNLYLWQYYENNEG